MRTLTYIHAEKCIYLVLSNEYQTSKLLVTLSSSDDSMILEDFRKISNSFHFVYVNTLLSLRKHRFLSHFQTHDNFQTSGKTRKKSKCFLFCLLFFKWPTTNYSYDYYLCIDKKLSPSFDIYDFQFLHFCALCSSFQKKTGQLSILSLYPCNFLTSRVIDDGGGEKRQQVLQHFKHFNESIRNQGKKYS